MGLLSSPQRLLLPHLLLVLIVHVRRHLTVGIPENLVQEHIKKNADFSVDPCDDFYAHVCPATTTGRFFFDLMDIKKNITERFKQRHPEFQQFTQEATDTNARLLEELVQSRELLEDLCNLDEPLFDDLTRFLASLEITKKRFARKTCEKKAAEMHNLKWPTANYRFARKTIVAAHDTSVAHSLIHSLDGKARALFTKMKRAVARTIAKTPWALKKHVVKKYLKALKDIRFTSFADLRNATSSVFKEHTKVVKRCVKRLYRFNDDIADAICDAVASEVSLAMLKEPVENVYAADKSGIFDDNLQMWNSKDDHVYMGNDMMLLMNTDFPSDLFGSIGFTLTHEIMHSFVFDDKDFEDEKPLASLWTTNTQCVEEQNLKTCHTFPTIDCDDTRRTFEEDAADLTAYRIVWDVYQKAYTRKTKVDNYESLDRKQLFFYGAAVLFCEQDGMLRKELAFNIHSNGYQRVNSLMSQMDQFSSAFHCKPTDKMVRNKATHCDLYGKSAPWSRKSSN